ncbi:MAG: hypothetical protein ACRDZY_11245, partial [Acidimicrobiales bacterium]
MNQQSPAARDRAQRRVRVLTTGTALGAGVLTLVGAAAAAGTFAGRTLASTPSTTSGQAAPSPDAGSGLQQPTQAPGDGSGLGNGSVDG